MAELNSAGAWPEADRPNGKFLLAREIGVAVIIASAVLAWLCVTASAADVGVSELTIRAPGVAAIPTTVRPTTPPASRPPTSLPKPGVQHAFQPATPDSVAGATAPRSGPVVHRALPLGSVAGNRMAVRHANQESALPGGTEYLRGTGVPPIGSLTINTLPAAGRLPDTVDRIAEMESQLGTHEFHREWLNYSYFWEAPAFYNRPLYFEQVNLERYGYNWGCFQPVVSGAQFFVKIPLLPYMMTVHPPCEHVYSLGYYRPGDCVPYQINWPEVRLDAILVEGAFITGLCFLIP